jgi:hypothetical protein
MRWNAEIGSALLFGTGAYPSADCAPPVDENAAHFIWMVFYWSRWTDLNRQPTDYK